MGKLNLQNLATLDQANEKKKGNKAIKNVLRNEFVSGISAGSSDMQGGRSSRQNDFDLIDELDDNKLGLGDDMSDNDDNGMVSSRMRKMNDQNDLGMRSMFYSEQKNDQMSSSRKEPLKTEDDEAVTLNKK